MSLGKEIEKLREDIEDVVFGKGPGYCDIDVDKPWASVVEIGNKRTTTKLKRCFKIEHTNDTCWYDEGTLIRRKTKVSRIS